MQDDFSRPATPPVEPNPEPEVPASETDAALQEAPAAGSEAPQPGVLPTLEPAAPMNTKPVVGGARRWPGKKFWLLVVLVLLAGAAAAWWFVLRPAPQTAASHLAAQGSGQKRPASSSATSATGLQLDEKKNYGDKYASGVLPVGDGKYQTTGAKQGYVYACSGYAQNLATDSGGAGVRGPWFSSDGKTYDINKKAYVSGSVMWQSSFTNTVSGTTRTITSNDLPDHPTGIFPIRASDAAYAYDKNPNSITAQNFTYTLPADPTYGTPQCIGGQVGVMLTGVAIFSGFDAGGRDAGAWEVQDSCSGHPEKTGTYHYHTLSSCIKDTSVHTVIGFALDGFPISGPKVGPNNVLTTSDLDECHGITSQITLDGKSVTMYHYVMTQDFPYSVSCYRAKAIQPPGQHQGTPTNQGGQTGTATQQAPPPPRL